MTVVVTDVELFVAQNNNIIQVWNDMRVNCCFLVNYSSEIFEKLGIKIFFIKEVSYVQQSFIFDLKKTPVIL